MLLLIILVAGQPPENPVFLERSTSTRKTKRPQVNRSTFPPQRVMKVAGQLSRQPHNSHQQKAGVERERKASSLRAAPPRPPPARHFHFKQDFVCFSFSCPRFRKK